MAPQPRLPLIEALAKFDRASVAADVKLAEKERETIRASFPLDKWPDVTLDRYALGVDRGTGENYCHLLEFGSKHLGLFTGPAKKGVVYKRRNAEGWYFPERFQNEQQAWEELRKSIVEALDLGRRGEWSAIDTLDPLINGPMLRVKTLHLYYPEQLLPIYSRDHLEQLILAVEGPDAETSLRDDIKHYNVVKLNRRLLAALRATKKVDGWTTVEMQKFMYAWNPPRRSQRVLKIAPGKDAIYWSECLAGDYICVGWDEVGDLRDYESKEAFRKAFAEKVDYDAEGKETEKANEVWRLTELEAGDIIIANKGISKVLGVGTVTDAGYEWRPERKTYKHTVNVKWDTRYAQEIPPQGRWRFVTVAPVPPTLYKMIMSKGMSEEAKAQVEDPIPPFYEEMGRTLERKGQLVLYGPPGTGKTYHARAFAAWWIRQQGLQPGASADSGQVTRRFWWIVANPKEWAWDTLFQKGKVTYRYGRLQRNYPLVQPGDLVFGYQSTPDKKLMAIARITRGLTQEAGREPTIELEPVRKIANGPTFDDMLEEPLLAEAEPTRFRNQGTLFALTTEESKRLLEMVAENNPDILDDVEAETQVAQLTQVTFHPSYSYEDFIEGFRPATDRRGAPTLKLEDGLFKRICREAQGRPDRRYLLLIDEFNRANVSKVFGELITLIEHDKRGASTLLPQSKQTFVIPKNVYVLATMNTSDRSIKLLDAALRRRFAFREIMPDPETLRGDEIQGLNLSRFLEELNRRITATLGREKQIGHSYLLADEEAISTPEEFARRFREEILPLLQEYCYDEYTALAKYLGSKLVDAQAQALNDEIVNDDDALLAALAEEYAPRP